MRPSEIATTIINGNIADARTAMIGREVSSKSRGALNAIEVIEELVDTYGWDWGPACSTCAASSTARSPSPTCSVRGW